MLDGIPVAILGSIGAPGLLAIVILMILTGRLVPRSHLEDMREAKDHWRAACEREQEANRLHARAADARTIVDETVVRVMSSIQENASTKDGG